MNWSPMLLVIIFLLLDCSTSNGPDDSLSSTIEAHIFSVDGSEPAEELPIRLFDAASPDSLPVSIAITDQHGRFSFNDLPDGVYYVWGEHASQVIFHDSITVPAHPPLMDDDSLEEASTITGIIALEPQHEPTSISVSLYGTGKSIRVTDHDGWFTLQGCPSGDCHLLIECALPGYLPETVKVTVSPASHDTLDDTLHLPYTGIPVITGITILQDTIAGTVQLSWNKTTCTGFKDYVIYKEGCSAIDLLPEPSIATTDTFFIDPVFAMVVPNPADTLPYCIKYRIAVRTIENRIGLTNGFLRIPVTPKAWAWTFIGHTLTCEGKAFDSISINDTVVYTVQVSNRTRRLHSLVWYDPSTGRSIQAADFPDTGYASFTDSIRYAFSTVDIHTLYAFVTDEAGKEWGEVVTIKTVIDTLAVNAGENIGVFVGDTVHLEGDAYHLFGTIPLWRWKIGNSDWDSVSSPDYAFIAPDTEASVLCSLWITDEDGTSDTDTVRFISSRKVTTIAAGLNFSLFIKDDGSLWACGENSLGQLGDGTILHRYAPVRVMSGVRAIAAGDYHSLILTDEGMLYACGDNSNGQFGDGTTEGRLRPGKIMSDVRDIAAGSLVSLILKNDLSLWVCGWDTAGRVSTPVRKQYAPVHLMDSVQSMATSGNHILIGKTDGTLWTCGENMMGQLGDGTRTNRYSPVHVMSDVVKVAVGFAYSLVIAADGTAYSFGANNQGFLGDGTTSTRLQPQAIMTEIAGIAAGKMHSLFLQSDGTLYSCGSDDYGQQANGNNSTTPVSAPAVITTDVIQIAAGGYHTLILKNDGSLWSVGKNNVGQLGIGSLGDRASLMRVIPYYSYTLH